MGLIDTGTVKVSDGGVDANFKLGGGQNAATRAVLQGQEHYNTPHQYAPMANFSIADQFLPSAGFPINFSASSEFSGGYSDAMMHADLQFWGWEAAPGTGHMN